MKADQQGFEHSESFSLQSEQSLLASLLTDEQAREECLHLVSPEDFVVTRNRVLFNLIRTMSQASMAIDIVTVNEFATQKGVLEQLDGYPFLVSLVTSLFAPKNAKAYAKTIRGLSLKRKSVGLFAHYQEQLSDPSLKNIEETLDEFSLQLDEIKSQASRRQKETRSLDAYASEVLDEIDQRVQGLLKNQALTTGIESFDKVFKSFTPGALILVGARPAMGKTSFALDISSRIAYETEKPTLVFSFEMAGTQLCYRILSSQSLLPLGDIRSEHITESQWGAIGNGVSKLSKLNIWINDETNMTVSQVAATAKKLWRKHGGLAMVVIDYLQLLNLGQKAERNKAEAIEDASRSLKILAQELGCPVVVLSQLNRALEQRADKRPVVSDLRGSGALEQDADAIILLYRDEVYNPDTIDKGITEVIIGKQRDGPIAVVPLQSDLKTFTYADAYTPST